MRHAFALSLSVALSLTPLAALAQAPPACGPWQAEVFEPGCEGPPRLTCDEGASLPALSTWCACDGRTVTSMSMSPPSGVRYRFRGACEVAVRFEVTAERGARGARSGRDVVFVQVGDVSMEVTRAPGPCREGTASPGELARAVCGAGAVLTARVRGDEVVISDGTRELARVPAPHGQGLRGDALQRR